ncbi:hypothetical protein [Streptomyces sp. NPDC058867]|uniref:hypothetical protein n=1 Tax=unclassified Streptomyces TaxID=2593676 RepID=UPI003695015F
MTQATRHTTGRVRAGRYATALVATGTLVTLAACSNAKTSSSEAGTQPSESNSSSWSATPSSQDDPQATEKAAVLDAYSRFWDEQVKAYAKGSLTGTDFARYAAALALASTEDDLNVLRSKGIVTTGAPTHATTVEDIQPDKKVPSAKLSDCLDSTDWTFIYRKTGRPVDMPEERLIRYVTNVQAEKWGKQWKIVKVTPQQDAC